MNCNIGDVVEIVPYRGMNMKIEKLIGETTVWRFILPEVCLMVLLYKILI